ncbi:MAG: hypothetical protein DRP14_02805 [Candidatus Aenigmatarchaeota archaeon]|nr:MAG: hypothetical protein DRP14_02805 [Candidatus Aenigmarchaeota archaeon]
MIWILLLLVGLISVVYFGKRGKDHLVFSGLVSALLSVILLAAFVPKGITTYRQLVGQLHEIKVLQQRIDDIRAAVYPEQPGDLVGGSLTNLQQSSKLSDYLRRVAEAEAEYSSLLVRARFYKKDYMWIVFGHGLFISDKVFQLPEIKGG